MKTNVIEERNIQIASVIEIVEETEVNEYNGFTTAGTFACVASWGACVSSGSSFSSAGD